MYNREHLKSALDGSELPGIKLRLDVDVGVETIEDVLRSIDEIQAFDYNITGHKIVID